MTRERIASSLARPPALRMKWASPSARPAYFAGSSLVSMQVKHPWRHQDRWPATPHGSDALPASVPPKSGKGNAPSDFSEFAARDGTGHALRYSGFSSHARHRSRSDAGGPSPTQSKRRPGRSSSVSMILAKGGSPAYQRGSRHSLTSESRAHRRHSRNRLPSQSAWTGPRRNSQPRRSSTPPDRRHAPLFQPVHTARSA